MPEIEEIRRRREFAQTMGGPEKVKRQLASGRLTVRDRIARLTDPGSFAEIGALTGFGDYDAGSSYVPVNPAWDAVVGNLSLVPVVAACLGPVVGLGAARLVMSHLAVMVTGVGQLFTAGPPVVRSGTGEELTKEELGGAAVHHRNGTIERFAVSEDAAFAIIRDFLSYLPASVNETPPVTGCQDPAARREESLVWA